MSKPTAPHLGLRIYTKVHRPKAEVLRQLADVGVGDIADAMHGIGAMNSRIVQLFTPMGRIFGPAITADLTPGDGMLMRPSIEAAQPGDILVVNAHGVTERAVLGGGVAMQMVRYGIKGLVVDGAVRDIEEFKALGLPVMARAVTPRSGTSATGYGECNLPIACGGVVVHPGDIVIGDSEGLVVVPRVWASALAASLGTTGHTAYAPEAIRTKLAAIAPNSPPQWTEKLQKSLKDRNATVIEDYYSDWREEV